MPKFYEEFLSHFVRPRLEINDIHIQDFFYPPTAILPSCLSTFNNYPPPYYAQNVLICSCVLPFPNI